MTDDAADTLHFKASASAAVARFPRERYLQFIKHLKVQSRDYGLVPFRLLGSQRYTLEEVCKGLDEGVTTFVILKSRQIGMTTFWISVDMFWAFQHQGLLGTFILHKEEARDEWRTAIEVFYNEIPAKIRVGGRSIPFRIAKQHHNRNILSFANGSRFRYLIAGTSENRKGGMGRSSASNFVHGTEVAFWGNEDDIRAFKSSVSGLYKHRLQVYESTANGFNHFYDTVETAKSSPTMRFIFVGWWRDERMAFAADDPRYPIYSEAKLTPLERSRIRAVKEAYGFDITKNQLAWYRWKFEDEFSGDQAMMDQEFPWTEDDAFQATGSQYFTTESLSNALKYAKSRPYKRYRYRFTRDWRDTQVIGAPHDPRAELRIWEDASKFGYYSVGCDPAYGSSDEADRNVISVWRGYADCLVQVAEYCTSHDSTYQTAWVLAHLAGYYGTNEARVNLEVNGPGNAVFTELDRVKDQLRELRSNDEDYSLRNVLRNMRAFYYRRDDSLTGGDMVFHTKMNSNIKPGIMARFKDSLELGRLVIRSVPLLEEMRRIVNDEGYIGAEGAHKDDRVIAAALAHESWYRWQWKRLRGLAHTRERAHAIEKAGGEKPVDKLMMNYLRRHQIAVPGVNS
jgi:hypothetical protein